MARADGDPPLDAVAETARQWLRNGWSDPLAMYTTTSAIRTDQIWQAAMERTLAEFDLTVARYEVLIILRFSQRGSMPLGRISERLQVHPTSVTSVIDRLEERGFLERQSHPSDRRATLAVITPSGHAVVEKAQLAVGEQVFGRLGLSRTEQRTLVRLLNKARRAAGDEVNREILDHIWDRVEEV